MRTKVDHEVEFNLMAQFLNKFPKNFCKVQIPNNTALVKDHLFNFFRKKRIPLHKLFAIHSV